MLKWAESWVQCSFCQSAGRLCSQCLQSLCDSFSRKLGTIGRKEIECGKASLILFQFQLSRVFKGF